MNRDDYRSHDAVGLAELVRTREVSATELLDCALELADERDPRVGAIVLRDDERAREHARSGPEGPLAGVPFLLKDLNAPMQGLRMTNGCRMFADHVPDHDSELVHRYRQSGLVIFGRSASPEFGITTSTESALHGQTRNPWSLEHSAGGSSGGAAAAVAAGILPVAHASDGGGSIRIPASCCGLFGLKPTRARVPKGPDVGEGWSGLSTDHVVSRTVRDSAALLDAVSGPELGAPYCAPPAERPFVDEVGRSPGRLRVALTTAAFNGVEVDPECAAAARAAAELLASLGHEVSEAAPEIDRDAVADATRLIVAANVLDTLEQRAAERGRPLDPERDVEPLTWATAQVARERGADAYARAIRVIHRTGRALARFFLDHDLLLSPTMAVPPPPLGVLSLSQQDSERFLPTLLGTIGFTQLMNVAGNPAMSVPLHWSAGGLPVGVQVAAPFGEDAILFRVAAQLEGERPWRDRRPAV